MIRNEGGPLVIDAAHQPIERGVVRGAVKTGVGDDPARWSADIFEIRRGHSRMLENYLQKNEGAPLPGRDRTDAARDSVRTDDPRCSPSLLELQVRSRLVGAGSLLVIRNRPRADLYGFRGGWVPASSDLLPLADPVFRAGTMHRGGSRLDRVLLVLLGEHLCFERTLA